jgi:hypothetical protein
MNTVALVTADQELGLVNASTATKRAQSEANALGQTVTLRDPTSDKVIKTVRPTKQAKAKIAAEKAAKKAAAKRTAKAAKPTAERKPRGMVIDILKLASRPNGVTPAELNKLPSGRVHRGSGCSPIPRRPALRPLGLQVQVRGRQRRRDALLRHCEVTPWRPIASFPIARNRISVIPITATDILPRHSPCIDGHRDRHSKGA